MKTHLKLLAVILSIHHANAGVQGSDDFNDNSLDSSKWISFQSPVANFLEINQRLEHTPGSGDALSAATLLTWIKNFATYDTSWELIIDVVNLATPTGVNQESQIALMVGGVGHSLSTGLESSWEDSSRPGFHGFFSETLDHPDSKVVLDSDSTSGAVRIVFDKDSKVISSYYDDNGPVGGYSWTLLGSYGIAGNGGTSANEFWNMSGSDMFSISLFANNNGISVSGGKLYIDNFSATTTSNKPPTISSIANQSIPAGSATPEILFTVDDSETPAEDLVVIAASSNVNLLPLSNIELSGSGANRKVKATPIFGMIGISTVTLTVSDGTATGDEDFVLSVYSAGPVDPDIAVDQPFGSKLVSKSSKKSFGTSKVGVTGMSRIFTIRNEGGVMLTGLVVTKGGAQKGDFVVAQPGKTLLRPNESTTFKVKFKPSGKGARNAVLHIKSNDPDENPFDIKIAGAGAVK